MAAKRAFDLVFSIFILLVTLPFWAVAILGIKFSSPGPIFFRGVRAGRQGKPFKIFKFRTMILDADRLGGGTTALNDPRVFPFGAFLRRFKLDELPQMLNVICGEMSLVGPRPELLAYTSRYTAEEQAILSVLPGITDYSSIRYSSLDEVVGAKEADKAFEELVLPEKNRLRLEYVRTRSFQGDLEILFLTVRCLVAKLFCAL